MVDSRIGRGTRIEPNLPRQSLPPVPGNPLPRASSRGEVFGAPALLVIMGWLHICRSTTSREKPTHWLAAANHVRLSIRGTCGFHSPKAALAVVTSACATIELHPPHEPVPG
jgi:hypothetical protein